MACSAPSADATRSSAAASAFSSATLSTRLLASFDADDPGLDAFVERTLTPAQREGLIDQLEEGSAERAPQLLRMLLTLRLTRLDAARRAVHLAQQGATPNSPPITPRSPPN